MEWQPIETAPRDGTPVLLWLRAPWCEARIARWHAPWSAWIDPKSTPIMPDDEAFGIGRDLPTHWAKLEPPA